MSAVFVWVPLEFGWIDLELESRQSVIFSPVVFEIVDPGHRHNHAEGRQQRRQQRQQVQVNDDSKYKSTTIATTIT
jgi:hypothetical protein